MSYYEAKMEFLGVMPTYGGGLFYIAIPNKDVKGYMRRHCLVKTSSLFVPCGNYRAENLWEDNNLPECPHREICKDSMCVSVQKRKVFSTAESL